MKAPLCFVAISLLLLSCHKSDNAALGAPCGTPQQHPVTNSDMLSMAFKTGTYWIYLDSVTQAIDSNVITSDVHNYYTTQNNCDSYEQYGYNTLDYPGSTSANYLVMYLRFAKNPHDIDGGLHLYSTDSISTYDSLYVYDRYYRKIQRTRFQTDNAPAGDKTEYYTSAEYGIVRKDMFTSASVLTSRKLLVRKHMVK